MKKITMIALAVLTAVSAGAQTVYDATNIAQKDLNGTARFVGMGGAMGALGGDISTIGTNPAGIGVYRSNDAMITFGYSTTGTESKYLGTKFEENKNRWSFDNAGFVISTKIGNHTPLRYVNFGFNYHKTKSFYKNMTMQGMMGSLDGQYVSQIRSMAQQATDGASEFYHRPQYDYPNDGKYLNYGSNNIYNNLYAGWLGAMGYQGNLFYEDESETNNVYSPYIPSEADAYFLSRERGGIDQYDFNISFNVNDRFYFGVTFGAYDVDYNKYSLYDEAFNYTWEDGKNYEEGYSLESFNRIHGSGFDIKLGAIFRPIEDSPFRIGLAVHTPTYYKLTYTTGALLNSDMYLPDGNGDETLTRTTVDTYSALGGRDMDRDFELQTPWVFNASLGYTVGNYLALGAEYEYEDYSSMKFKYPGGDEMAWETGEADLCMKGVNTLRLGAEYKPIPAFALRAGYNYSSAAYKENAIKALPTNSINTDTDFANSKSMNTFTLGIGYRGSLLYADLAYKYDMYKSDFYPFYNDINGPVTPPATSVTNTRSQVLLTLGVRF
ncbi:OmpP1/FadL family transporter [Bacteroides sp.]|uniref:OmpP1/FadL family transporter n=1 Tax=Bacteroides sp. TaxID=29523 RepID=UPI003AB17555